MNGTKGLSALLCLFVLPLWATAQKKYEFSHRQMGTQIGLIFYAPDGVDAQGIAQSVFQRIDDLNATLSNYIADSELNRLGKSPHKEIPVSADLYRILKASVTYSENTDGAFDITIGALIALWKSALNAGQVPTDSQIKAALKRSGYVNLEFPAENKVLLKKTDMQLDLGGIGKGFAADEAIKVLAHLGITSALVDMGGDITVSGPPPNKEYWILGFSYFNEQGEEVFQKIKLRDQAVATSGDLYQYTLIEGKRYSHIIDPKTGRALSNNIQVTTIAPNGTMADAYASALSVLGIAKGKEMIGEITGLSAFMVADIPGNYAQWNTPDFWEHTVADQ